MASQLKSGAPTYGQMYELYVIAAVVVGGTSLSGGEGKILGTLIGAFIIAVIQNGMNLTGVESYTQKIVLGPRHPRRRPARPAQAGAVAKRLLKPIRPTRANGWSGSCSPAGREGRADPQALPRGAE